VGVAGTARNFFGCPLLFQERVKLPASNLAGTFTGSTRIKIIKTFGEMGAWAYTGLTGTAHTFGYPLLSHNRVKRRTSNFYAHS